MKPGRRVFAAVALLAALVSCRSEEPLTQIVVVVDSDWDGFDRVDIEVKGFGPGARTEAKKLRSGKPLPRRVALVHEGGRLGPIGVTVRAFQPADSEPALVEARSGIFFVAGKTRMLKIDLLFKCIGDCGEDMACIADNECVASDDPRAIELVDWDGKVDALDVIYRVDEGAVLLAPDGGTMPMPGTDGAVSDADTGRGGRGGEADSGAAGGSPHVEADAGPVMSAPVFPFAPANFDPEASAIADAERGAVVFDCGETLFDSTSLSFTNACDQQVPALAVEQADGSDAAVLVMDTLTLAPGSSLRLKGERPVILAVFGDARIGGTIDASASGTAPGPGADRGCETGAGGDGANGTSSGSGSQYAGSGGGGGGFGSSGAAGGRGRNGTGSNGVAGSAGAAAEGAGLVPLRGGCSGGRGGAGASSDDRAPGGGGGGAVQISAAGRLDLYGKVVAGGGGGGVGGRAQDGGGGGGSGGAILLEGAELDIDGTAVVSANGGAGGAGQPTSFTDPTSAPGGDGLAGLDAALGGQATGSGGDGGAGGTRDEWPAAGQDGGTALGSGGAGGGGGGGVGRIQLNRASSCVVRGLFSPRAEVTCPDCGACPSAPEIGCEPSIRAAQLYYFCPNAKDWNAARASCAAKSMHLAVIGDEAENDWMVGMISGETWIGAHDSEAEGIWYWDGQSSAFWIGDASGSAQGGAYVGWPDDEPNNGPDPNSDCAVIAPNGLWHDRGCSDAYPYVCQQ